MNKIKVSKKHFNGDRVLKVGYCELQHLLSYKQPIAYNSGVNGWNCDFYAIEDIIISTGYSPCGDSLPYERIKHYEDKAREIKENRSSSYEDTEKQLNELINQLVKEFKETL